MKRAILILLMLAGGLATGGGAAFGVAAVTGPREPPKKEVLPMPTFVATGPLLVPLVDSDGGLAGYATIEVQLEVAADAKEDVASRLPVLLNAINLRTYRAPLASGPDRLLPDLAAFRQLVLTAAVETYGKDTVISATGLKAQSLRMRIIAENLANSDSIARTPGGDPYRRKMVVFRPTPMNSGGDGVEVQSVTTDRSAFERSYQPGSPAADARGYVLKANVNGLVEAADMRSAQRSYEANVNAIEAARAMTLRTIDLIK